MNRRHLYDAFDTELCLIGAATDAALLGEVKRVLNFLEHAPEDVLPDVAYTCACKARGQPSVLAVVAASADDLRDRLTLAHAKLSENAKRIRDKSGTYFFRDRLCPQGRVAFLFPGVMSFYPDMLRDLSRVFEDCRSAFDELEEAAQTADGYFVPSDFVFPPTPSHRPDMLSFASDAFSEALITTHVANTALYRILHRVGIAPDGLLGFSGGDLSALDAAGVYGNLSHHKRVTFLRDGYQMLTHLEDREGLPDCAMFAVQDASHALLDTLLAKYPGRIVVTALHSPRHWSIALSPEIERNVVADVAQAGAKTVPIPKVPPFNTPWCAKVLPTIHQFLTHWVRHVPKIPVYSSATGGRIPARPRDILQLSVDQWIAPIRLEEVINRMYEDGFRIFIEVGARGNLTTAVSEILKNQPHQAVAANRIHRSGITQLHHALGILAAQGVRFDATLLYRHRAMRMLDFKKVVAVAAPARAHAQRLCAQYAAIQAFSPLEFDLAAPAQAKAPAEAARKKPSRLSDKRQSSFGADFPLLINADVLNEQPSVLLEVAKAISPHEYPFLKDYAIGTHQLSLSAPSLTGLPVLSLASGLEIMAEAARKLVPRTRVAQVDNLRAQRWIGFERGAVRLLVRAERIAWDDARYTAVKVQLRDDAPNSAFTWPIIEATILLVAMNAASQPPAQPPPLENPRQVNWSGQEIYPERLTHGGSLRAIRHVDLWSEEGIDFEIEVPDRTEAVRYTRMPLFSVWPQLLDGIAASFTLWRSHERFTGGAVSLPFRARRILFHAPGFTEKALLRGYLRLTAVTPRSHVADIQVSDGNGNLLIEIRGWEEICERVPTEYHRYILRPSERFLSGELPQDALGNPDAPVTTAVITDVPFKTLENNQEIWLKALAHVLLTPKECGEWLDMQGTASRRAEWLFGRAAAKEAVRRYLLKKDPQSRWASADIEIWADDAGKPHPVGPWAEALKAADLDISIAHTSKLIVAAAAANARIGIDIESVGRDLSEDFTNGVFTPEEMELAAQAGEGPAGMLKFWCAKEAISKALGTGIRYSPRDLHIVSADLARGHVQIRLLGQWLDAFKQFKGRENTVRTSIHAGHALASCIFSNTLFGD
ncbi:MAG: polyketide synthase dehydratase domain-containing protein [Kiritimatiellaeota bacterium]|nr:polyketide synthase dehydratase domain-containing protein [Kiritimatiellota bacterium]